MNTRAVIHLEHLRHNCRVLSEFADRPVLAPIKANGYGHGAVLVAQALEPEAHVVGFAVATTSEVLELRQAGIGKDVVLLTPPAPEDVSRLVVANTSFVVSSLREAELLEREALAQQARIKVHLKINTGLNRLGARPEDGAQLLAWLGRSSHLALEGIMTHLVDSEDREPEHATRQIECFNQFLETHRPDVRYRHAANTGGVLNRDLRAVFDLVRPGIGLYGYAPGPDMQGIVALKPAMSLIARVIFVNRVQAGEVTSYNATWTASRATTLATIRLGYADGYPRILSNKAQAVLNGHVVPIAGRVCMDQILLDVADLEVQVGAEAVMFGPGPITAETLANQSSTNSYEILTGIAARVERVPERLATTV